jgi:hypothetical protein
MSPMRWQILITVGGLLTLAMSLSLSVWGSWQFGAFLVAILGACMVSSGMLAALASSKATPTQIVVIISRCVASLLVSGVCVVALAVMQDIYTGQAPYLVVALLVLAFPLAVIALSEFAHRSDAAYLACCGILLCVLMIAAYSTHAIVELLVEIPELRAEHFIRPARTHVFNLVVTGLIALIGLVTGVGLTRVICAELTASFGRGIVEC